MGWFSRSPGTKGRSKKKKPTKARAPWDPAKAWLAAKALGVVAVLLLIVLGWNRSEQVLGKYASQTRAQEVYPDSVELVDAPAWMDALLSERLREMVAFDVGSDPLDGRGLSRAAERLRDDPWVASVEQVRRAPDGVVRVTASYRQPAALVAGKRGYHLVDRQAVWLDGPVDRAATRWSGLPLITGVAAPPPAAPGRTWAGSDIEAALTLEELLRPEPYAEQVTAYDVSHRDQMGRLWLVLYTPGPAIVWGLPPGREKSVEPDAPVKLGALRDWAYQHGGRIDSGANVVWVYTGIAQRDARPTVSAGP